MTSLEAISARHSVRQYDGRPIAAKAAAILNEEITKCNAEGGIHLQLIVDEPKSFTTGMGHYGKFSGVVNYIALVGAKGPDLDEKLGYYGERIVLLDQTLGLNTCWVCLTYGKVPNTYFCDKGEEIEGVIAIGYGLTQGVEHKSKPIEAIAKLKGDEPDWFATGLKAALLAPTAMNQQKFTMSYEGGKVGATAARAFFSKMDLGIVKCHFELGSGQAHSIWR